MNTPERYLITAALPYANGLKHIGHLAGAYLPADIYVRYLKANKKDVVFICGSDEHGTAIPIQAKKEGLSPKQLIDKYHTEIYDNFYDLGIRFDLYYRTSDALHHETAQEFFTNLYNQGFLEEKSSQEYYDPEAKAFLADRYIKGTCPNCQFPNAFGDQCEKCGKSLSPDELINPVSTISGATPIKKNTTHWYLPLQKYEDFLRQWILEDNGSTWRTNVLGQCKSWLDGGLQARAITRDLDWGIQVPLPNAEGKVLYVWFDAPIGYISATKQWAKNNHKDWKPYWYDSKTQLVHFIGKDNIVFHCLIFPVMLKLHGNILPFNVPANEFLNLEGDKMSTSRGWSLEMDYFIKNWVKNKPENYIMADVLRYYLTAIAPETKDSEFTWKGFQDANNNELVNNLGNFVNRTWVLMHKYCRGRVPKIVPEHFNDLDKDLIEKIKHTKTKISGLIEKFKFRESLFEIMELSRQGNIYLQKNQPWILAQNITPENKAQEQIDRCIFLCLQLTANLSIFINPFLPIVAEKLCKHMKVLPKMLDWEHAGSIELLSPNYPLPQPSLIFKKIDNEDIQLELEKLRKNMETNQPAPIQTESATQASNPNTPTSNPSNFDELAPLITIDDFSKIDLRVGKIIAASKVPKADKLLELKVDLGFETRTIVSGIAEHFKAEELIGQVVTVVANLAPRKMRGIESNGMILLASDATGKLHFVHTQDNTINGCKIK
ncbi:MAG: methionine--tRNA ligase [Alphaproteobacteria bacterium]|nr:methionine--tRNA ligase [Alphaproteobacteria bacterium]